MSTAFPFSVSAAINEHISYFKNKDTPPDQKWESIQELIAISGEKLSRADSQRLRKALFTELQRQQAANAKTSPLDRDQVHGFLVLTQLAKTPKIPEDILEKVNGCVTAMIEHNLVFIDQQRKGSTERLSALALLEKAESVPLPEMLRDKINGLEKVHDALRQQVDAIMARNESVEDLCRKSADLPDSTPLFYNRQNPRPIAKSRFPKGLFSCCTQAPADD